MVTDAIAHVDDGFHVPWLALFMQISAWVMIGLGTAYMLLGICCMNSVRDRVVKEKDMQWKAYRQEMKLYNSTK